VERNTTTPKQIKKLKNMSTVMKKRPLTGNNTESKLQN